MNIAWLLRLARWARRPPGPRTVRLWLIVIGLALAIAGIEHFLGWPEALTMEPRRSVFRP
ncbi:MAG: hypothetical protein CMN17_12185 [Roseovarius sp.]|nr:hypothetical protein [Roseovarius sp.]MBK44711.1 hypothetical protein [Roseovarius sp.]|tara:strand:- start:214 stop:393 length:180 start_codon:yes stop_codon:yes gene_type:complete